MNRVLALDTSGGACSVALAWDGETVMHHDATPRQQMRLLLPLVHDLLVSVGGSVPQLDGLVVGTGPGSFTGVRIAIATAQGLALGGDIPLAGISSLRGLAQGQACAAAAVLTCLDARLGEVYWASYDVSDGVAQVRMPPTVSAPDEMTLPDTVFVGVGSGFSLDAVRFAADRASTTDPRAEPSASDLLAIALRRGAECFGNPDAVGPDYLRQKVAHAAG